MENRVYTEDMVVFFLQMPKTGSSTLDEIVLRQYDGKHVYHTSKVIAAHYDDWKQIPICERWEFARNALSSIEAARAKTLKVVMGHMWYGWHEAVDRPSAYVTFLRHPVRRYVSYYNFIRGLSGHSAADKIRNRSLGIGDLLQYADIETASLQENLQVKLLTGDFSPTLETLEQAIQNLHDHFALTGLTETFDEDLLLLREKLGWTMPFYRRKNVSTKYESLDRMSPKLTDAKIER